MHWASGRFRMSALSAPDLSQWAPPAGRMSDCQSKDLSENILERLPCRNLRILFRADIIPKVLECPRLPEYIIPNTRKDVRRYAR